MKKFTKQEIIELYGQVTLGEISLSRMVEILNEMVSEAEEKCIEDIPKRKFKAGDKVTLKSRCISKTDLEYLPFFDKYIGERLEVVGYTESGNVQCNNYFYFHEDWLEPYVEELKKGDLAIFWDNEKEIAIIKPYGRPDGGEEDYFQHKDQNGFRWRNAIKFESKEQFNRFIKGEI